MDEVVVKQGYLHLQQQQTFGKGQRKDLSGPRLEGVLRKSGQPCMEENELYSSSATVVAQKKFSVTIRPTEASERCRLRGAYILQAGESALELWDSPELGTRLYDWPYRFLRRFGRDKVTFTFEAGRRCFSGEGNFEFETQQGNEIFLALEEAISAQKNAVSPGPQTQPTTIPTVMPQPESPYSRPHDSLPPPSPRALVPALRPRGPEGEYAVPFDAVAQSLGKSLRGIMAVPPQPPADPLYDSIEEHLAPRPEHIYDEPEGVAALPLYDSPQGPQGEAWRRQAKADRDPSDLQHVFPAGQDFSASGWPQGTEYDNLVLKKGPK
ncbi:docking protein 2 isoform X3 [Loxodonta africana]|uniref:docking protein 2 isoform X3 n=1 Tax=Loxodonta africana TaxID=9785 RepID=UPI0030D15368